MGKLNFRGYLISRFFLLAKFAKIWCTQKYVFYSIHGSLYCLRFSNLCTIFHTMGITDYFWIQALSSTSYAKFQNFQGPTLFGRTLQGLEKRKQNFNDFQWRVATRLTIYRSQQRIIKTLQQTSNKPKHICNLLQIQYNHYDAFCHTTINYR